MNDEIDNPKLLPEYLQTTDLYGSWLSNFNRKDESHAGVYKFMNTDSEELYEKNLKQKPSDWHYRFKEVNYTINSSGYRAPEWNTIDWKESIVVFGCSCVGGIGVSDDETITHYLSQHFDRPVINLGKPGSSIDFSFYNSMQFYENFPAPWAVINVWTSPNRTTLFLPDQLRHEGQWTAQHDAGRKEYWLEYILDPEHMYSTASLLFKSSQLFWKNRTRYYQTSFFVDTANLLNCKPLPFDSNGRDGSHAGHIANNKAAKIIFENMRIEKLL